MNKFSIVMNSLILTVSTVGTSQANITFSDDTSKVQTGFYAGINAGVAFDKMRLRAHHASLINFDGRCNQSSDLTSFNPGLQVGYLHQYPDSLLSGLEITTDLNSKKNKLTCRSPFTPNISDRFSIENQLQTTIKARVGQALIWDKQVFLPYLTVGASLASTRLAYDNEINNHYSKRVMQPGLLLGTGIEWGLMKKWTLRAEYTYSRYHDSTRLKIPMIYGLIDSRGNARYDRDSNKILLAVNYWM